MSASGSTPFKRNDDASLWLFVGMLVLSVGGHIAAVLILPGALSRPEPKQRVEMEFYEPPPPPPPPKVEEPPKEEPPKPVVKLKPPPVKIAEKVPPPPIDAPPPPNDTPPPEPQKVMPMIVAGISLSSTTAAGGFAVPVGNTTYGKADKVVDPSQVKAYVAPQYVPPGGADTEPERIGDEIRPPYPPEAKKNEIEGQVRLKLKIDAEGKVTEVVVVSGPGYGLNEAARDAIRLARFKPATKNGEKVGTTILYTYLFLLD